MTVVLDTPEAINAFRMLAIHKRLKLEIAGITFGINTHVAVRRELGLPPRTPRKKVLAAWEAEMTKKGIRFSK